MPESSQPSPLRRHFRNGIKHGNPHDPSAGMTIRDPIPVFHLGIRCFELWPMKLATSAAASASSESTQRVNLVIVLTAAGCTCRCGVDLRGRLSYRQTVDHGSPTEPVVSLAEVSGALPFSSWFDLRDLLQPLFKRGLIVVCLDHMGGVF